MSGHVNQFSFQHKYSHGAILNVGCDTDSSNFKGRGAVNVDIWDYNPFTRARIPADLIADVRALPASLHGRFDSVVIGDILEHFVSPDDVLLALANCQRCLKPGGRLVLTCPEDRRPATEQGESGEKMYTGGVRAYHAYPVTRETIRGWCAAAGLAVVIEEHIAYPFLPETGGWGVVAVPFPTPVSPAGLPAKVSEKGDPTP